MIISHGAAHWWRDMYCAAEPAHISLPLMQNRVIGLWRFVFGYIPLGFAVPLAVAVLLLLYALTVSDIFVFLSFLLAYNKCILFI